MDRLADSISAFQTAIRLNPRYSDAYHDLGYVFHMNGQPMEAIASYHKAIEINRNMFDAYNNLGRVRQELGDIDEALVSYRKSLEIKPDFAEAHFNLAIALLLKGDFDHGWREYEWRKRLNHRPRYDLHQQEWNGSDISGKTIFLYAEQGFGDTIQFVRFAPLVAEKGARVIIECQRELMSVMQSVKGGNLVISNEDALPEFDLLCPLLSLPLIFHTAPDSIPKDIPYIMTEPTLVQKWRERMKDDSGCCRVGLVWSGNPKYRADRLRSVTLEILLPLWEIEGMRFYSLQKGDAANQVRSLPGWATIADYSDELSNFSDTAAMIANLDLVISVDTAVAHLSGALGKNVWTLLPYAPDWRWMLHREDSPWYPTMTLFRQPAPGDWKSVVEKLSEELPKYRKV